MKEKISGAFRSFSRTVVDPILYLAVIGLILAISVVLTLDGLPDVLKSLGALLSSVTNAAIIGNLGLLLCVGLAGGFAKKQKSNAAVLGLLVYLMFIYANNTFLTMTDMLAEPGSAGMGLFATGQAVVLGLQVTDVNVFGGIILGCITGYVYNKSLEVKFPEVLRIYGGPRFALIIMIFLTIVLAVLSAYIWPVIANAINSLSDFINNTGSFGVFTFGFLNRTLIPTGLHHFMWMPFNFTPVGGTAVIDGVAYYGATNIFYAQMPLIANGTITVLDPSIRFASFAFAKIFGALGAVLAMIKLARPEHKKAVIGMLIPIYLVAMLSGITEALDFIIVFISPLLWIVHGVLTGLSEMVLYLFGNQTYNIFGGIELLVINLALPISVTKLYIYVGVGIVFTVLWYFVYIFVIKKFNFKSPGRDADWGLEAGSATDADPTIEDAKFVLDGIGGNGNIQSVSCCMTRLRVTVKDASLIEEAVIKNANQKGVIINGKEVQVIIGLKVQDFYELFKPIAKIQE